MSDEEDPFEQFEDVSDREGDPFEQFDDIEDEADDDAANTESVDSEWGGDPLGGSETTADEATGEAVDETASERANASPDETTAEPRYDAHDTTPADHVDELPDEPPDGESDTADAEGVVEMEEPEIDTGSEDPFSDVGKRAGDPFEDDVFEEMDIDEMDPDEVWASIADAEERGSVGQKADRIYAEVSKHRFCEQCEFFSDPPDVACSHEGTEILEFLDQETVRLVDCPVVAERKELEKHD